MRDGESARPAEAGLLVPEQSGGTGMAGEMLDRLAALAGIEAGWTDFFGHYRVVPAETKKAFLSAMGFSVGDEAAVAASLADLEGEPWRRPLPPVSGGHRGRRSAGGDGHAGAGQSRCPSRLVPARGGRYLARWPLVAPGPAGDRATDDRWRDFPTARLPVARRSLCRECIACRSPAETARRRRPTLIVAPSAAHLPKAMEEGRRPVGVARPSSMRCGASGTGALAISPILAS